MKLLILLLITYISFINGKQFPSLIESMSTSSMSVENIAGLKVFCPVSDYALILDTSSSVNDEEFEAFQKAAHTILDQINFNNGNALVTSKFHVADTRVPGQSTGPTDVQKQELAGKYESDFYDLAGAHEAVDKLHTFHELVRLSVPGLDEHCKELYESINEPKPEGDEEIIKQWAAGVKAAKSKYSADGCYAQMEKYAKETLGKHWVGSTNILGPMEQGVAYLAGSNKPYKKLIILADGFDNIGEHNDGRMSRFAALGNYARANNVEIVFILLELNTKSTHFKRSYTELMQRAIDFKQSNRGKWTRSSVTITLYPVPAIVSEDHEGKMVQTVSAFNNLEKKAYQVAQRICRTGTRELHFDSGKWLMGVYETMHPVKATCNPDITKEVIKESAKGNEENEQMWIGKAEKNIAGPNPEQYWKMITKRREHKVEGGVRCEREVYGLSSMLKRKCPLDNYSVVIVLGYASKDYNSRGVEVGKNANQHLGLLRATEIVKEIEKLGYKGDRIFLDTLGAGSQKTVRSGTSSLSSGAIKVINQKVVVTCYQNIPQEMVDAIVPSQTSEELINGFAARKSSYSEGMTDEFREIIRSVGNNPDLN